MTEPRFHLYIKATSNGTGVGDCPFSQRSYMYCLLKGLTTDLKIVPIDFNAKPAEFLKLTPKGTTPVLVDTHTDHVITDSAEISMYLDQLFPETDKLHVDESALDAIGGVFPKLWAYLKNKESSVEEEKKAALIEELQKLNTFLRCKSSAGKYLIGDRLCELDCQILPKLRHLQVAGKHIKNFEIPSELNTLKEYIKAGESHEVFQSTSASDEEILIGWKRRLE